MSRKIHAVRKLNLIYNSILRHKFHHCFLKWKYCVRMYAYKSLKEHYELELYSTNALWRSIVLRLTAKAAAYMNWLIKRDAFLKWRLLKIHNEFLYENFISRQRLSDSIATWH